MRKALSLLLPLSNTPLKHSTLLSSVLSSRSNINRRNCSSETKFQQLVKNQALHKYEKEFLSAAKHVIESDAVLITAGAGIGVDSDFRGNEGFWKAYPPLKDLNVSFQDMANPLWFKKDPALAWGFYGHRLNMYRNTVPHKGFEFLKTIAHIKDNNCFIFTSNVDGQKAGFSDEQIVECHGSIHHIQCLDPTECTAPAISTAESVNVEVDSKTFKASMNSIPKCPAEKCKHIARPNVLMFGDWDWIATRTMAQEEAFMSWEHKVFLNRQKLLVIDIGSGLGNGFTSLISNDALLTVIAAIPTVRRTAERMASEYNGFLIRINLRDPEIPSSYGMKGVSLPFGAAEALNTIDLILQHELIAAN